MPFAESLEQVISTIQDSLADGKISIIEIFRIIKAVIGLLGVLTTHAESKIET